MLNNFIIDNSTTLWNLFSVFSVFLQRIVGAVSAFETLQLLGSLIKWKRKKYIATYFDNCMAVYLLHQQLIYCSISLLLGVPVFVHVLINFIISIGLSLLISLVLMRFRPTRFMIGC